MRVDIDQQDIANALADTRRKFDRARGELIVSLSLLAIIFCASGFALWRAGAAIMAAAPAPSLDGLVFVYQTETGLFLTAGLSAALILLSAAAALAVLKARNKRAAARKDEALNHPLSAGKFEFIFAADKLTIMGPQSVRKISWNNFATIENRKSSIVFHRKDGQYDFIPKNVVPDGNFYDLMMVKHGPLLNKPCPYEEANLTKPLSVTYETARQDLDDYYAHYFKKRDGRLYPFRRLCQWRPWVPFLFLVATAFTVGFGYVAFNTYSLLHAGAAIAYALIAAAIFVMNGRYFRGAAHPFRKNEDWPYAQTDLATVSLTNEGVFHARHGATDFIRWGAFNTYVESKLFGYLVVAPKHVIALPKRAFLDKAHFDDFTQYAKRSITQAKKERSDAERGRMMRSLGDKTEPKKERAQARQPKQVAPAPAPAKVPAPKPQLVKPTGPSPKAAPAQVKMEKPKLQPRAPEAAQQPAMKTPQQQPALKPAPKPAATQPAAAAPVPAQKSAPKPASKQPPNKKALQKPSAETQAILHAALKKAAELDAKAKEAAPAEPPQKKTAAE